MRSSAMVSHRRQDVDQLRAGIERRGTQELACGASRYYLHHDVAAEYFGFEPTSPSDVSLAPSDRTSRPHTKLHLEDLLTTPRSVNQRLNTNLEKFAGMSGLHDTRQALEARLARREARRATWLMVLGAMVGVCTGQRDG